MRLSDLSSARRDLAEWSEPLIADRIGEIYAICFGGDPQRVRPMTLQHCRLWRNLLLQDSGRVQNARRELIRLGRLAGLEAQTIDRIDEAVLDELADVVVARFHRSPIATRDYNKSLIRAASSLAEARLAA